MLLRNFFILISIISCSCDFLPDDNSQNIARFDEAYFTKNDLFILLDNNDRHDSTSITNKIINEWAIEKILIQKAELNLSKSKLNNIDSLVEEYRFNLLSEAYLSALVNSKLNLEIDTTDIELIYNKNKNLFSLNDDILKLAYIEIPLDFSDKYQVITKLKRFRENDIKFLDSISFRFNNYSLKKSEWLTKKELLNQFSFLNDKSYTILKNYDFYQYKDSLSLYLIKINKLVKEGQLAPMEYVLPTLNYMSLNKRKKDLMKSIESDLLRDALLNNKFEIF